MEVRPATSPDQLPALGTGALRARFLVEDLFGAGALRTVYSHEDRVVIGGARPAPGQEIRLETARPLRSAYFLERRELAVVNVGGPGAVQVDGARYELASQECLYVGRGAQDVVFAGGEHATGGEQEPEPAFYLVSTAAHATCPTRKAGPGDAARSRLGAADGSNARTIYRYIHADGIQSCQLVLGLTVLEPGSMWNTMPCHTHGRRSEIYLYFGLDPAHRVIHLMGRPDETRPIVVANEQAVISPCWSVHCGFGTRSYAFVWAMAGENQAYEDMDPVAVTEMR
jgi:4-deoxy-L-threo-5-hexosulose-uronate ketol-isomerase